MEDAIRGPLDVVTIAVSAGGELRDWGLALAPPGVSALWPVLLWDDSVQNALRSREVLGREAKGKA